MDTGVLVLHLQPPSVNWSSENLTAALSQAHAASMVVLSAPFLNDSEPGTCFSCVCVCVCVYVCVPTTLHVHVRSITMYRTWRLHSCVYM
jgi:hypothetical protein